jgi:hypothetical protein
MRRNVLLLRVSYWSGAALDAAMIIPMLSPGSAV